MLALFFLQPITQRNCEKYDYFFNKICFSKLYFIFSSKNRSSLWNKACDELKKHQEFVAKVKATMPDFQTEPNLGDPFTSDDIKEFAASLEEADTENEEDADEAAKEELEQVGIL